MIVDQLTITRRIIMEEHEHIHEVIGEIEVWHDQYGITVGSHGHACVMSVEEAIVLKYLLNKVLKEAKS
jgi:hypothetical protein